MASAFAIGTVPACAFAQENAALSSSADPAEPQQGETVTVTGTRRQTTQSADALALFRHVAGFSAYSAGGVSSLPALNGMADDRVATFVDGMRPASACPNHMNPAMSYIDPDQVSQAVAIAGITPVSLGGDSTGGTISVQRKDPLFARDGRWMVSGQSRGEYRNNNGGSGASTSLTVANDRVSLRYSASYAHASDYFAGGGGGRVLSTAYLTYNHAVTLGLKKKDHFLALTFGQQDIPYEAFPNQYMDMTNNRSSFVNGAYKGRYGWGRLEVRGYWQRVTHVMNLLSDKGGHSATTGMPMNSDGRTAAYAVKATIPLNRRHEIGLGSAFDHNGLNDWWPPVKGSKMMGPGTYHSLNGAFRDRLGHYVEWKARWTERFSTQLGLRNDVVMMNTGPVSPYAWTGMMAAADAAAASRFNRTRRGRTDVNIDLTALATWRITESVSFEGGYARKTRSPNLYERYAWGRSDMVTRMIGWFGDGNGYVGRPDLKPEIAHTLSVTLRWRDPDGKRWKTKLQPFYTATQDYINVVRIGTLSNGLSKLRFANHTARSYGVNASGSLQVWNTPHGGQGELRGTLSWVRGQDLVTRSGLYHQMPLNGLIGFYETAGRWSARAEVTLVKPKSTVDWLRNEPRTAGYALLGLGGRYRWRFLALDASLENVLNQKYALPLGGREVSAPHDTPLPVALLGMGRSFTFSLKAAF